MTGAPDERDASMVCMKSSYPPPFSTTSAALDSTNWFCAFAWYACGSALGSEITEVTCTWSPPTCWTTSPHTLVEATTRIGAGPDESADAEPAEEPPEAPEQAEMARPATAARANTPSRPRPRQALTVLIITLDRIADRSARSSGPEVRNPTGRCATAVRSTAAARATSGPVSTRGKGAGTLLKDFLDDGAGQPRCSAG